MGVQTACPSTPHPHSPGSQIFSILLCIIGVMFSLDSFGGFFSCKFWGLKGKLKSSNEQFYLFYVQNGSVGVLLSTLPMRTYKMVTLARTPEDIKTSVLQYGMAYRSPASDPCHTVLQPSNFDYSSGERMILEYTAGPPNTTVFYTTRCPLHKAGRFATFTNKRSYLQC